MPLALICPKDIFGMLPLFGSTVQTYDASALSDVLVCRVSAGTLEDLIRHNPHIALKFFRALGEKLREYQTALETTYTKSVKERLALVLVKLAKQHGLRARLGVRISSLEPLNSGASGDAPSERQGGSRRAALLSRQTTARQETRPPNDKVALGGRLS